MDDGQNRRKTVQSTIPHEYSGAELTHLCTPCSWSPNDPINEAYTISLPFELVLLGIVKLVDNITQCLGSIYKFSVVVVKFIDVDDETRLFRA